MPITKALTKTTNCTCGAKKWRDTTRKFFWLFAPDTCPRFQIRSGATDYYIQTLLHICRPIISFKCPSAAIFLGTWYLTFNEKENKTPTPSKTKWKNLKVAISGVRRLGYKGHLIVRTFTWRPLVTKKLSHFFRNKPIIMSSSRSCSAGKWSASAWPRDVSTQGVALVADQATGRL